MTLAEKYSKYLDKNTHVDLRDFGKRREFGIKALFTEWFPKYKQFYATKIEFDDGSTYDQIADGRPFAEQPEGMFIVRSGETPKPSPQEAIDKSADAIVTMYKALVRGGIDGPDAAGIIRTFIGAKDA